MQERTLEYYNNKASQLAERYDQIEFSEFQSELIGNFSGTNKVLEIGCGSGRDAAFLTSHGLEVTATDGSKAMLEEAGRAHPELKGRLRFARLPEKLPFGDSAFDGVYSVATLMHLPKEGITKSIGEIHRVLRPGGLFFFSVSLERDDIDRQTNLDRHGRLFTLLPKEEWNSLCTQVGFKQERFTTSTDSAGRKNPVWGNFLYIKKRL